MTEQADAIVAMGRELTKVGDVVLSLKDQQGQLGAKVSQMRVDTNECLDSLCDTVQLVMVNLSMLMKHFGVLNTLEGHVIQRPYKRHSGRDGAGDSSSPREA
jgi:hypothetical protein